MISRGVSEAFEISDRGSYRQGAFDFEALKSEVKSASRVSFRKICANHPDQSIRSFGLLTDECPMTISPAANSVEAVEQERRPIYKDELKCNVSAWAFDDGASYFDVPYRRILTRSQGDIPFERELPGDTFSAHALETFVKRLKNSEQRTSFAAVQTYPSSC